jgi:hypothetical protein
MSERDARLTGEELAALVERVFRPRPGLDRRLALLVDLPPEVAADRPGWRARRALAAAWSRALAPLASSLGLEAVALVGYRAVGANNADLPPTAWLHAPDAPLPATAGELDAARARPFEELLAQHQLQIAITEYSATAPLKLAARRLGFRAATMPGFSAAMIPALRLDYGEVDRRVRALAALLDGAERALLVCSAEGAEHALAVDLRHRGAHASSGLIREPGSAGNLPSGEAYIVPYEGERAGDPSRTAGVLPVQLGREGGERSEVVCYRIDGNRARAVVGAAGPVAAAEAALLAREPAYGNIAELGLGVLAELGVEPCGELLLDEKLGLHVAFGRSDHFGGQVGAAQFSRPEAVVHIDRVYLPSLQPRVEVVSLDLEGAGGRSVALMRGGRYAIDFAAPPRWAVV